MDAKGGNSGNNGLPNEMNNSKDASSDSLVSDSKSSSLNSKLGQDHVCILFYLIMFLLLRSTFKKSFYH